LIYSGCKDDQHAFDQEYFNDTEKIFESLIPIINGEKHPEIQTDALIYAFNTIFGRTVRAYISFALRVARVTQKKEDNWGHKKYERFFALGIDAHILFGSYLPQMNYLDPDYTKEKIQAFIQKSSDDFEWKMFMEGYLINSKVYQDLYHQMRANYFKALENKIFSEEIDRRLVDHICLGYLNSDEHLPSPNNDEQDSLFGKMLLEANVLDKRERWLEVVNIFWAQTNRSLQDIEEKISENIRNKVLKFWAWTFENQNLVETNLTEDYHSFLGKIAVFIIFLDKIDEEKEKWLLLCAPHIVPYHSATFFIEYLTKFDDEESIKRIGNIFKKILENTTPDYKKENIELIIRRIYKKGNPVDADSICGTYGRQGLHFLRSIWDEYHKNKKLS
jgi:hypothetical protein